MLLTHTDRRHSQPIEVRGITKRYGAFVALDRIDVSVARGEFLTLLGPSGSGKTTLLMVLAGFVRAQSGSIRVGGEEIIRMPPHKRSIGIVFQNYALFPHLTVGENVAYPLRLRKTGAAERQRRVHDVLELVQLGGLEDRRIDQLSGGQRQRVALARAIVFEPGILLMDEPLSALDKNLREQMQFEIKRLHERLGVTIVYVTHDQREALTMSDRVAVMNRGRIVQIDRPLELYERPRSQFVAGFVGQSYFLPVEHRDNEVWHDGAVLHCDPERVAAGTECYLVLRPEKLRIAGPGDCGPQDNRFAGTLRGVSYQGDQTTVFVALDSGTEIGLRCSAQRDEIARIPPIGAPIVLALHRDDAVVVRA